jgi:CheY-like chemotaxis protein
MSINENISTTYNWQGKTILIVEDDISNMDLFYEILKRTNITIIKAYNGEQAIEYVKEKPEIDLILMDIKMPVLNGYKALETIKILKPNIKIIAQTAFALIDDREMILSRGFDEYIAKPVEKNKLLLLISQYL